MPGNSEPTRPADVAEKMQDAAEQFWNRVQTGIFQTFSVPDLLDLDSIPTDTLQTWLEKQPANPGQRLATRDLFTCALVLCEAADPVPDLEARLEKLLVLARAVQLTHGRTARHRRGNFCWWIEGQIKKILQKRGVLPQKPIHIDPNGTDFCMRGATLLWLRHRHRLSEETRTLLKRIIRTSLDYCITFSVPPRYTNIALMNAMNLMLSGQDMGDSRALQTGIRRFDKFCLLTWEWGIHEFTSPNYTAVHLYCLGLISRFGPNPRIREQANSLQELLWTNVALSWMRYYERPGGAMSRVTHKLLFNMGGLPLNLWTVGWLRRQNVLIRYFENPKTAQYVEDPLSLLNIVYQYLADWEPPQSVYELTREDGLRPDRYTVRQSWGTEPSQSCTYFYDSTVSLGSSSAPYDYPAWEDMPLVANLSESSVRPLSSMPARPDDPDQRWFCAGRFFFIPIQLKEDQRAHGGTFEDVQEAFCNLTYGHPVPQVWTVAQHRGDALGGVLYSRSLLKKRDKTAELADLYSCFALNIPVKMEDTAGASISVWIGETEHIIEKAPEQNQEVLMFSSGSPTLPIYEDQEIVFCQTDEQGGWNAVALQAVWSSLSLLSELRTLSVLPGGGIGAVLLCIPHGHPDHPEMPLSGIAFRTRIGRGKNRKAFDQWHKKFASDGLKSRILGISPGWNGPPTDRSKARRRPPETLHHVEIEAVSADGQPLKWKIESLDMEHFKTSVTPTPSKAVLEIETGDRTLDLGRKILKQIPLISAYEQDLNRTLPVRVPGYWQAARGRVQNPVIIAEKPAGGSCVWVPRFDLNSEGVGSVAWRLHIPRNGVYYIWARIRSKTGRGAFRVSLYRDKSNPLYQRRWLVPGIDGWAWVPMDLNELAPGWRHTPLRLPKGEVILQIFAQSHSYDIGINRLFITANPRKRPSAPEPKGLEIRTRWSGTPLRGRS